MHNQAMQPTPVPRAAVGRRYPYLINLTNSLPPKHHRPVYENNFVLFSGPSKHANACSRKDCRYLMILLKNVAKYLYRGG